MERWANSITEHSDDVEGMWKAIDAYDDWWHRESLVREILSMLWFFLVQAELFATWNCVHRWEFPDLTAMMDEMMRREGR